MITAKNDLTRTLLAVISILLLIAGTVWVIKPFLAPLIWAIMIVISTWPVMLSLQERFNNRRGLAVTVMVIGQALILFVPLTLAILMVLANLDRISEFANGLIQRGMQGPPEWLVGLPLVGEKAGVAWNRFIANGVDGVLANIQPYVRQVFAWAAAQAGTLGLLALHFLLVVILSAVLYSAGEGYADYVKRFARRLSNERGEGIVTLAGKAIQSVAMGIVITALVQSTLGGIGLAVAGVPLPGLLTAVMLILCVAQLGPGLVLIPSTIWMFSQGDAMWGSFLVVWTVIVGTMDNFLRPWLIKKGADLPLLLIFAGVIGGLLAFGIIGLFIGPVVLAVTFTLLSAWINSGESPDNEGVATPPKAS